ncbi:MAG: hypothetical protein AB1696_17595 [Planctomycetota bacterium]
MLRYYACALIFLVLCSVSMVGAKDAGPVTLTCGDLTVVLDDTKAFTIKQITYKDFPMLAEGAGLHSGTVLSLGGDKWIGSGFGDEKVSLRLLKVDKKQEKFKEGATYTAKDKIIYEKKSSLGPFKLNWAMEIRTNEISHHLELKRSRSVPVEKMYAFLFPFTKEFNLFCGQVWGDTDLAKRFDGAFYGENADLLGDNIRWFTVYCNERHTGIVCAYGKEYKGEEEQTILIDKPELREYHFRPKIMHDGRGEDLEFELIMHFLECKQGELAKKSCQIVGSKWGPDMGNGK